MSKSLEINFNWLSEPAIIDPLERRTWGEFGIVAGADEITLVFDRQTGETRSRLRLPLFPIAEWFIENWWALLFEPSRKERISSQPVLDPWVERHCLRSAEAGLLLPRAFIYSDGERICLEWFADPEDAYPQMPGYFPDGGRVELEPADVKSALHTFIDGVERRVADDPTDRAMGFRERWQAIKNSSLLSKQDETTFCRAAGKMGLDPYDLTTWKPDLIDLLETKIDFQTDAVLAEDFLEVAKPESAGATWEWVSRTKGKFNLKSGQPRAEVQVQPSYDAARTGYQRAKRIRRLLSLQDGSPIQSLPAASSTLGMDFNYLEHNHSPSTDVQAVVGWQSQHQIVVAGPVAAATTSGRFLQGQALYYALYGCLKSPRIVRRSYTREQRIARAFSAELLAPRQLLCKTYEAASNPGKAIDELAEQFMVNPEVVKWQLHNAGEALPPWF
ncbi:MAG: hypothetical protein ACREJ2_01805 [Planctomycetota bacterium]